MKTETIILASAILLTGLMAGIFYLVQRYKTWDWKIK